MSIRKNKSDHKIIKKKTKKNQPTSSQNYEKAQKEEKI